MMMKNNIKMPALKIRSLVACMFAVIMLLSALSGKMAVVEAEASEPHPVRVADEADILTETEETDLLWQLDEVSERHQFDVVVVAVNSLEGEDIEDYAADYYDYNGYGLGDGYDGAMFLVSMEEREWFILTTGKGIDVLTDEEIDDFSEDFLPHLSNGSYDSVFGLFASFCDEQIQYANTEDVYGESSDQSQASGIVWPVIIGLVLAFIPVLIMRGQLKSVHMQTNAGSYEKRNTRKITVIKDTFLYHTINRVPKPKEDSSSTFHGSSGRSHGGRGGGF